MMTTDAKNRLGNTLETLHAMGYEPIGFSGYHDMYSTICTDGIPSDCISVGYAFRFAHTRNYIIVEITKNGFCAMREPNKSEMEELK